MTFIDSSSIQDNRNYDYSSFATNERTEYEKILTLIQPNSHVIDLGCGNGALMEKMIHEKGISCKGMEISASGIEICKQKGLDVIEGGIDVQLPFPDDSFDYAICNVTIQMTSYPDVLLKEMKRIANRQIVSFPNFAYFRNRLDLLLHGRMPKQLLFGYKWYNTGHIHQLSIKDMHELIDDIGGLKLIQQMAIPVGYTVLDRMGKFMPNLFQKIIILELEKC